MMLDIKQYKKQRKLKELQEDLARKRRLFKKAGLVNKYGPEIERLKKQIRMLEVQ